MSDLSINVSLLLADVYFCAKQVIQMCKDSAVEHETQGLETLTGLAPPGRPVFLP